MTNIFIGILLGFLALQTSAAGTTVQVNVSPDGEYRVQSIKPDFVFRGRVVANHGVYLVHRSGRDQVGPYSETLITPLTPAGKTKPNVYTIRVYEHQSSVLFIERVQSVSVGGLRFPTFDQMPNRNIQQLSSEHREFSPTTRGLSGDAPWIYFNTRGQTFILSPADHFMISNCFVDDQKRVSVGIENQVNEKSPSFEHSALLTFGSGVNQAYKIWGETLRKKSGKKWVPNDADATLDTLGYWTDNRSSYWYNFDKSLGYTGTLTSIQREFEDAGIHFGHLQLDSWWYLKGGDASAQPPLPVSWKQANYNHGIYTYEASPELFPKGLADFQQSIALPLVTHARWVDVSSPYLNQYKFSNQVSIDPAYWEMIMARLNKSGVQTYEQDWMNSKALPRLDRIEDADAFLDQMSRAAARYNIGLQYCMPLPRHFLQASRYENVRTIRPSGDGFEREKWNEFLYGSTLARAMGVWPWADVFFSADQSSLLIATLSGGIVGVGDRLTSTGDAGGDFNPDYCQHSLNCRTKQIGNLKRVIRADGVIVKPDRSLLPTDRSYVALSGLVPQSKPMVAAAYTDDELGSPLASYLFSYAQGEGTEEATLFERATELGFRGPVYVYDYLKRSGTLLASSESLKVSVARQGAYFLVTPASARGFAWLGDLDQFVSLGKKRIHLSESGQRLQVKFVPGEKFRTVSAHVSSIEEARDVQVAEGQLIHFEFDVTQKIAHWTLAPSFSSSSAAILKLNL